MSYIIEMVEFVAQIILDIITDMLVLMTMVMIQVIIIWQQRKYILIGALIAIKIFNLQSIVKYE